MSITVRCVKCGTTYPVKEKHAGKRFQCPQPGCNTTIIVPEVADAGGSPPRNQPSSVTLAPPPAQPAKVAEAVTCGHCGGLVASGPEVAGMVVSCPHCGSQIQMPAIAAQLYSPPVPVVAASSGPIMTATLAADDYVSCPMCGESIKAVAKRCRHCGETLDPVLRRAEEAERLAMQASNPGFVNVNNNVVVEAPVRRRRTGSTGGAVALEVIFGLFNIFGIGHFANGNVGMGLLSMFGYWFLLAVNGVLVFFFIGLITLPLTWIAFMVISPIVVASTPPVYYD